MTALQHRASVPFTFNGKPLSAIPHDNDLWLTGEDIGRALEYSYPRQAITKLYERNREELDNYSTVLKLPIASAESTQEGDTCEVNLTSQVGSEEVNLTPAGTTQLRDVRVFSEEGVMILTMLSGQPRAAAFRAWAVRVLKAYRHGNLVIASPSKRDQLLQTCIKEVRFGNPAAIHTLVHHFGYPETIAEAVGRNPFTGRGSAIVANSTPVMVQWFVDGFLPDLRSEVLAGSGPLLDQVRAHAETARYWKVTDGADGAFVIEFQMRDMQALAAEIGEARGVDAGCTGYAFRLGVRAHTPRIKMCGWTLSKPRKTMSDAEIWTLTMEVQP